MRLASSRLWRLVAVAINVGCAKRVVGGWRPLLRHVWFAGKGGWRSAYGTLIGFEALGGRGRTRRYRRWLQTLEASSSSPPHDLALAVTFAGLDDAQFERALSWLKEMTFCCRTFVAANSPYVDRALRELGAAGFDATPTADGAIADALAQECVGVVFLGAGCCLNSCRAGEMSKALNGGADLVYADSDELDASGRCRPRFKPDFSLDLLFYEDYMSECVGASKGFLSRAPAWDFDDPHSAILRWVALADSVDHVAAISSHALTKRTPAKAPPDALAAFLGERYGGHVDVSTDGWRCRFPAPAKTRITVVVPTRDRIDLLAPCIGSLYAKNRDIPFETIIVDNRSSEASTRAWLDDASSSRAELRVIDADVDFNWSRLNNIAIASTASDVFVFLNNDTESISEGWLGRIAEYALRPDVAAVGPLLLYEDGSIQHAGLVVGYGGCADSIYRATRPDYGDHVFVGPLIPREVSAVTGACMAISALTLAQIGTFDESFPISGDVELCLRARGKGLKNIYAADVRLFHYESLTRGRDEHMADGSALEALVQGDEARDPYYSPNLASVGGIGRGGPAFALLHE